MWNKRSRGVQIVSAIILIFLAVVIVVTAVAPY